MKVIRARSWAFAAIAFFATGSFADSPAHVLEARVASAFQSIEELRLLATEAKRLGLRAWLFGGSAAAVAHHARESAAADVEFADVFRWNQDVDVVVDAAAPEMSAETLAERAAQLEEHMVRTFPHFPGERARWEVRLLRHRRGDKAPLLGESYLWNQHNDSASIGLVEVTDPPSGEPRVRDGDRWDRRQSRFLDDAARGQITFLFAPGHDHTERSEDGLNPPVFSVIRFLTKKHQYALTTDEESSRHVAALAADFRASLERGTFPANAYVAKWLHHNVRKLLFNARDLPALWAELDALGLRDPLRKVTGDPAQIDSVAWWLSREPLPHRPLGLGAPPGAPTAGSLGYGRVTHFTKSLAAYEAIRRSVDYPNAFQSRDGESGERALYGDGFYVHPGEKEEPGGAYALELELDPDAVLGVDFHVIAKTGAILVVNRAALHMRPTPPGGDPVKFFSDLAGRGAEATGNLGILAQWRRRVASRFPSLQADRRDQVLGLVTKALHGSLGASEFLIREWFLMPASTRHPELFRELLARVAEPDAKWLLLQALQTPHWRQSPQSQAAIFALLQAPVEHFEGQRLEVALASTVLGAEDAWSTGWFEPAVFRLTLLHSAEHSLVRNVFLAPGFSTTPRSGKVVRNFVDFSYQRVETARALAASTAWTAHPDALSLASAFAKDPAALDPLFHSVLWRRTFARNGASLQSLGRLRRWLLAHDAKERAPRGLILPASCSDELMETQFVKE